MCAFALIDLNIHQDVEEHILQYSRKSRGSPGYRQRASPVQYIPIYKLRPQSRFLESVTTNFDAQESGKVGMNPRHSSIAFVLVDLYNALFYSTWKEFYCPG